MINHEIVESSAQVVKKVLDFSNYLTSPSSVIAILEMPTAGEVNLTLLFDT